MAFVENYTISTTLRHFSSRYENDSVCSAECDSNDDHRRFKDFFNIKFYANGSCIENEGHVSILFYLKSEWKFRSSFQYMKFRCSASVIDVSGNKRFTRSFTIDHQNNHDFRSRVPNDMLSEEGFGFDKYIKRSTLLDDPPELLPDDSLTLCLEVDYEIEFFPARVPTTCDGLHVDENGKWYLLTDTEFARYLCKMSSVFSRMLESPMAEKVTGRVPVQPNEISSYQLIFDLLCGFEFECTLSGLWELYKFADFYDMPEIKRTWHQLLVSTMSAMNSQEMVQSVIDTISELPEMLIKDETLRDILTLCSDMKNRFEGGTRELDASTACKLAEAEWNCELTSIIIEPKFVFRSIKKNYPKLDFYK